MGSLNVYKNRTNIIKVDMGFDVSADTITSEIRASKDDDSTLIATWDVAFETDGTDGMLILTLDDTITDAIEAKKGFMDLRRFSGGEPLNVFNAPLTVLFKETITVS